MSKCTSGYGEYSSHVLNSDGEYCDWCGELDMDAHDRKVKAEALREAAKYFQKVHGRQSGETYPEDMMLYADQIEGDYLDALGGDRG